MWNSRDNLNNLHSHSHPHSHPHSHSHSHPHPNSLNVHNRSHSHSHSQPDAAELLAASALAAYTGPGSPSSQGGSGGSLNPHNMYQAQALEALRMEQERQVAMQMAAAAHAQAQTHNTNNNNAAAGPGVPHHPHHYRAAAPTAVPPPVGLQHPQSHSHAHSHAQQYMAQQQQHQHQRHHHHHHHLTDDQDHKHQDGKDRDEDDDDEEDDDEEEEDEVEAMPVQDEDGPDEEEEEDPDETAVTAMVVEEPPPPPPPRHSSSSVSNTKKKSNVSSRGNSNKTTGNSNSNSNSSNTPASSKKKTSNTKKSPASSSKSQAPIGPTMDDTAPPITDEEYRNVEALMVQFCKVPLLAEFSRPVSLLHPELMSIYSKIVKHPMDLGKVCRGIRRRAYADTRAIRMDMWRIFTNCIKYHSHPSNKDNAVPAFISIALHLRDYFNALWEEFMMPSDMPPSLLAGKQPRGSPAALQRHAFDQREEHRAHRLTGTATTILSKPCLKKLQLALATFISSGGCVDALDRDAILNENDEEDDDLDIFCDNIAQYRQRLREIATSDHEYTVDEMVRDMRKCYNDDGMLEHRTASLRVKIANRIDRLIAKIVVPIYETSCRGVNQSSIWGCMAAAIWARESSKKPYWPALVLGILAPECQKEDWHKELTQRNEARLPEKLLSELQAGKKKAEQSIKRDTRLGPQQHSYFLVEFMGTHEFIWVKEGDIIESFDPDDDPNTATAAGNITKKKRSSRNIADSKTFLAAIEEGRWALEEFELQLTDSCGDQAEEDDADDEQELNYSYAVLGQSDDEAEEEHTDANLHNVELMTASDVEEGNELLATDGLIDFSAEGRKNARKRSLARKKERANAEKAAAKKQKDQQAKKVKDKRAKAKRESTDKKSTEKEKKDGEKPRKKRKPERKDQSKSNKKRRLATVHHPLGKLTDKRSRATSIVNGYLARLLKREELKNLCLAGVLNVPASVVDAQGLLGMALAFRAAAGEIPVPDDTTDSKFKPWEKFDVDGPKTSAERVKNLQKQLDMIERKVEEVRLATSQRQELTSKAREEYKQLEKAILAKEVAAKKEIMARTLKKKPVLKTPAKSVDEPVQNDVVLEGTVMVDDDGANKAEMIEVMVADDDDESEDDDEVVAATTVLHADDDDDV